MYLQYVILAVYLLAINLYGFFFVFSLKRRSLERGEPAKSGYGKIFLAGLLGGAAATYAGLLVFKYKTDKLLPMILLPILAALNIYAIVALLRSGILIIP